MKIKINLMSEEGTILQNEGKYSRIFKLSEKVKHSIELGSATAKIVINPGKEFELTDIMLNDQPVQFTRTKQEYFIGHWNIPIKITFDHNMLNVDGNNHLELLLEPSRRTLGVVA